MRRILMDMKKWMRCAAAVVLSVLVAFSATACSQPANIESGAVSQEYPVTVNEVTSKKGAVMSKLNVRSFFGDKFFYFCHCRTN